MLCPDRGSVIQKHSGRLATHGGLLAQRATLRSRYHEVHRGQAKCWRMGAGPILPLLRRSSVLARMSTMMQDVTLVGFCGAAFYDLRSGLHRRFLEQISNRPNRHCGDIHDGGRCLKKNAKAFRTHTTCYGLHCCESSSPACGMPGTRSTIGGSGSTKVLRASTKRPKCH